MELFMSDPQKLLASLGLPAFVSGVQPRSSQHGQQGDRETGHIKYLLASTGHF